MYTFICIGIITVNNNTPQHITTQHNTHNTPQHHNTSQHNTTLTTITTHHNITTLTTHHNTPQHHNTSQHTTTQHNTTLTTQHNTTHHSLYNIAYQDENSHVRSLYKVITKVRGIFKKLLKKRVRLLCVSQKYKMSILSIDYINSFIYSIHIYIYIYIYIY